MLSVKAIHVWVNSNGCNTIVLTNKHTNTCQHTYMWWSTIQDSVSRTPFLCVDLQRSLKVIGNVKLSVGNTIVWSGINYTRSSVCHERLLIVLGPIWAYEQRDQLVMLQWCGFWDVLIPDTVLRDGQK